MAVANPCCCCSLKVGTLIVAIFNLVCASLGLFWYVSLLAVSTGVAIIASTSYGGRNEDGSTNRVEMSEDEKKGLVVFGVIILVCTIIVVIFLVLQVAASISLLLGAQRRDIKKCWFWIYVNIAFLVMYSLYEMSKSGLTFWATSEQNGAGAGATLVGTILGLIIGSLFSLYQIWVVYAFIDETKREGVSAGAQQFQGVVYSTTPKNDDMAGSPAPPYSAGPGHPASGYAPAHVGYPVLPVHDDNMPRKH